MPIPPAEVGAFAGAALAGFSLAVPFLWKYLRTMHREITPASEAESKKNGPNLYAKIMQISEQMLTLQRGQFESTTGVSASIYQLAKRMDELTDDVRHAAAQREEILSRLARLEKS